MLRIILICLCGLMLTACSLPRGAALQSEIIEESNTRHPTFQVVPVTRANAPKIAAWPSHLHSGTAWPETSSGANASVIRTGDLLDVTIWDSQENSLLTRADEPRTEIRGVEVDAQGSIFLPYVEQIPVRGLTPSSARSRIQAQLAPIAPAAQVQVRLAQGRDHSVDVVTGVAKPGAYPMPSRNYKILNVLADSGGIDRQLRNPRVKLLRGAQTYVISSKLLFTDGSKNALLHPRDTVIVEEDDRSFTALGASGIEDMIYFPKDRINAIEAMSLMKGLSDSRADPKGVLILREYPPKALGRGPEMPQVVFTFDMTSADGLFAARNFDVLPEDTILATESPVSNVRTIFGLLGSALGVTAQAGRLGN